MCIIFLFPQELALCLEITLARYVRVYTEKACPLDRPLMRQGNCHRMSSQPGASPAGEMAEGSEHRAVHLCHRAELQVVSGERGCLELMRF